MDQHTCRLQTSHPIHITWSYATLLLSSTSAILLISPTKKPHITGFQQCTEMCDTHEGSSRTQWELQNSARSQTESTTVCYCLQKWPEQQPGGECKCKSLVERSMRAAGPQVRRFNKGFIPVDQQWEKTSYSFSSAQRTITGRLTGVESSREQAGAKIEINVIKEDERSEACKKEKTKIEQCRSWRYKNNKK